MGAGKPACILGVLVTVTVLTSIRVLSRRALQAAGTTNGHPDDAPRGLTRGMRVAPGVAHPTAANDGSRPLMTVGWNGRRYVATVVGIPGYTDDDRNQTRAEVFRAAWARAWPQLTIRFQASFFNDPSLRGLGCLVGHYMALHHLFANLGGNFDYVLMLEDDALPFEGTTWPGAGGPNHLDAHLDELKRLGGSGLILGGHDFRGWNMSDVSPLLDTFFGGITRARSAWGSYAYVLPRKSAYAVLRHYRIHMDAAKPGERLLGPDDILWEKLEMLRARRGWEGGGYVSTPLLVDHAPGISETWKRIKAIQRPWQGSNAWWKFSQP